MNWLRRLIGVMLSNMLYFITSAARLNSFCLNFNNLKWFLVLGENQFLIFSLNSLSWDLRNWSDFDRLQTILTSYFFKKCFKLQTKYFVLIIVLSSLTVSYRWQYQQDCRNYIQLKLWELSDPVNTDDNLSFIQWNPRKM